METFSKVLLGKSKHEISIELSACKKSHCSSGWTRQTTDVQAGQAICIVSQNRKTHTRAHTYTTHTNTNTSPHTRITPHTHTKHLHTHHHTHSHLKHRNTPYTHAHTRTHTRTRTHADHQHRIWRTRFSDLLPAALKSFLQSSSHKWVSLRRSFSLISNGAAGRRAGKPKTHIHKSQLVFEKQSSESDNVALSVINRSDPTLHEND